MKKILSLMAALSLVMAVSCNKDDNGGKKTLDVDLTLETEVSALKYGEPVDISAAASSSTVEKAEIISVSGSEGNWTECGEAQPLEISGEKISGQFFADSKAASALKITLAAGDASKEFFFPVEKVEGDFNVDIYINDAMKMKADSMVLNHSNNPDLFPVEFTGNGSDVPSFFSMHGVKVGDEVKHVLTLSEARPLDGKNLSFCWANVLQNTQNKAFIGSQRGYMFTSCKASALAGGTTGRQCDTYEVDGHKIDDKFVDVNFGMQLVAGSWSPNYKEDVYKFVDALYIKIPEKAETNLEKIKANWYISQIQKVLDNATLGEEENPTNLTFNTFLRRYAEAGDTSKKAIVENFRAGDYVIIRSKRGTAEEPVYYYGILQVLQLFDDSSAMATNESGKVYIDREKGKDLFLQPNYFAVKTQCEILK